MVSVDLIAAIGLGVAIALICIGLVITAVSLFDEL